MSKRETILKKVGHMSQLAYARNITYNDGRAKNLQAVLVKNGPLQFVIAKDKCMDIIELSYRGENINFLSKPGLQGLSHYDTNGSEAQRSIMGGLFFTCGLDNVGPNLDNVASALDCLGQSPNSYPMHGRIRSTPAENISVSCEWIDDQYIIKISGEMRQAMLFGENFLLKRTIETIYGNHTIKIHDEIINESFKTQPLMILYHFNIGYPMLDETSKISISSDYILARDDISSNGVNHALNVTEPLNNKIEEVFYHNLNDEHAYAKIENNDIGFKIGFKKSQLPFFTQWKSMASGDYVMGFEPGNCHVEGIIKETGNNTLEFIAPLGSKIIDLEIHLY